jgi:hypothetical protein
MNVVVDAFSCGLKLQYLEIKYVWYSQGIRINSCLK